MRDFLLFRLHGPLASWGEIAVGEERPSAPRPGRSAVLGMLAAACGVRRTDEATNRAMAEAYGLAVRVDQAGEILRDFHTMQVPPAPAIRRNPPRTRREELEALHRYRMHHPKHAGTMLSSREYRSDGMWTVAVWDRAESPPFPLDVLRQRLKRPHFVLYLGRKSCPPAVGLQPQVVPSTTLAGAFSAAEFTDPEELCAESGRQRPAEPVAPPAFFWDQDDGIDPGLDFIQRHVRRDQPHSRRRWQFVPRDELEGKLREREE